MRTRVLAVFLGGLTAAVAAGAEEAPDRILFNGQIVTVDSEFSLATAVAVRGDRILAVGSDEELLALATDRTERVDLEGRMVLPGLIDSHVHPTGAAVFEYDHPVPDVRNLDDVLRYIADRAEVLAEGEWIRVEQMFITRLDEQRFPTRAELDEVAPRHPVVYRTGPDLAVNSLAMKLSGLDDSFELPPDSSGRIERDEQGRLTGIIRGASHVIRYEASNRQPSEEERAQLLAQLLRDYNSHGITSIADRNAGDAALRLYERLRERGDLTCRVYLYYAVNGQDSPDAIRQRIEYAASHPLHTSDRWLWLRGIKVFLDGGMLTGSAYMLEPWGVSEIYSITDPDYRGTLYIEPERLYQIARLAVENGLQMTAHSVGDGAVQNLIDAYEQVDREIPVAEHRPCITHCNFMSADSISRMRRLGIVADLQPAWLYLDGATLLRQFGAERTRYFQPYRSLFEAEVTIGGGSDHMQKIGGLRSVNPYDPFLGMWIALTRLPRGMETPLHAEQQITREQALRLYTTNNAFLSFEENEKGSIEPGKLADLIVIDRDFLHCPVNEIRDIRVLRTYVGGALVFDRNDGRSPEPE